MATDDPRYAPNPKVLLTELRDGSAVLLHLDTKFYFTLNAVGVVVWKALWEDRARSLEALTAVVCAEFAVEAAVAATDLRALLRELQDESLVQIGGAP